MRISSVRIATCTLATTFLVSSAIPQAANVAQNASSKDTVRLMETRYRAAKTLQATFLERYTENGRLTRVEAGTAYFLRPGKMRWEYESPEKNLFLVDGKTAWFYVPSDHTATRVPAKQSSDWRTPLALLAGEMKVSRVCARVAVTTDEKPESAGNTMLSCALRGAQAEDAKPGAAAAGGAAPSSQQQTVYFEVAKSTGDLVRVLAHDPGGVGIEFHFENWRMNPPISDALFHFSAPLGVAIVNGELPPAQNSVKP
jgi:outer membrane lipoprotein carrier protein